MIPQVFSYAPVPVGTKAISPAKPDAQYKPGESSQQECYQVPFSGRREHPSGDIEQSEQGVEGKEEII